MQGKAKIAELLTKVAVTGLFAAGIFMPVTAQDRPGATSQAAEADTAKISERGNAPKITARFVPDSIAIGDRFTLEVDVDKDIMSLIAFPEFDNNMLGDVIEIQAIKDDTVSHEGRNVVLRRTYLLQTFEDGLLSMGKFPMLYAEKNITDTIWSADSLFIKVGTFQIDTSTMTIYDIKPTVGVPLKAGEVMGYSLIVFGVILAIAGTVWWRYTRRRNLSLMGKPKPVEPPHVLAIKALENLHNQKLWQNHKHKAYYSGLTDVLREYIEKRYGVRAMEMTSGEIMGSLEVRGLSAKAFNELQELLRTADFVKFAKLEPDAEQNEKSYTTAYYFIEETKPDEVEPGSADQVDSL